MIEPESQDIEEQASLAIAATTEKIVSYRKVRGFVRESLEKQAEKMLNDLTQNIQLEK